GPDRAVVKAPAGRADSGHGRRIPGIPGRIVATAGVELVAAVVFAAPDDHFAAGPHGTMTAARAGRPGGGERNAPGVAGRVVAAAVVEPAAVVSATPGDHFAAGPDRAV